MKKMIKKIIAIFTLTALLLCLTACGGKTFKCGICNEEKNGKSYKSQLMGENITICEDCYKEMNGLLGN